MEAILAAVSAVLVAAIAAWSARSTAKLRQENEEQHAEGRALVSHVSTQVNGLHDSFERRFDHVDARMDKLDDGQDAIVLWQLRHVAEHAGTNRPVDDDDRS